MERLLVVLVAIGSSTAMADPAICGHGKPDMIDVRDAAADPGATIFLGRVAALHVSDNSFEARTGTIDVDVQTVVQGVIRAARVEVPAWAAGCFPKAVCLASVFDIAKPGTTVLVACVVPAHGAPRTAIVAGDRPVPDDIRRCLAIDDTRAHDHNDNVTDRRVAAIASAYVEGGELAKTCAGRIVCDDAQRAIAVRALVKTVLAPKLATERSLDLAEALTFPVSSAATLIGCPTTPKFFRSELGGDDAMNALIAHTMLDGMLAAGDATHRKRWANLLWGMVIEWNAKPGEDAKALRGLDKRFARRASELLRVLARGDGDGEHYLQLAKTIDGTTP